MISGLSYRSSNPEGCLYFTWPKYLWEEYESVAERTLCVLRVNYFDRWSCHIFSPNEDNKSHSVQMTFPGKSNSVKARQTFSSSPSFKQDGCVSVLTLTAAVSLHHEESRLNSRALEFTLLDPRVPS